MLLKTTLWSFTCALFLAFSFNATSFAEAPRYETFTNEQVDQMKAKKAIIHTSFGEIKLKFFPDVAPNHVNNFITLAESGFYDTTTIHRIVPGFVIQGGDPNGDGTGGPGYTLKEEFNDKSHLRGVLSMARSSDPDSAGSQFFICLDDVTNLDNNYTVFGEVVEGMDVIDTMVSRTYLSGNTPISKPTLEIDVVSELDNVGSTDCKIEIRGITISGTCEVGSPITFITNAQNSCSSTIYYRHSVHPEYGTPSYDGLQWTSMTSTEYTTENSIDYTFDKAGKYIVVVWAKNASSDSNTGVEIIGVSVNINEKGEGPYFPF